MLLGGIVVVWTTVSAVFARSLRAIWREPTFRTPIAILESDDWGAGPAEQADALKRLSSILGAARNQLGETPVMTVGVVLETIDRDASRATGAYVAASLSDKAHTGVLDALVDGERSGVFALQLHGLAHYWPASLLAAEATDTAVAAWLAEPGLGWTETLPSPLQSRWTDGSVLPSRSLPDAAQAAAARAEVDAWRGLFGARPAVAVPPTFVWNPAVERAWFDAGVRTLVTPGARHERRAADGAPERAKGGILNGDRGDSGMLFLVRDVYFEPVMGHPPARLTDGVLARAALGRPALVEMHRFNFCGPRAMPTAFEILANALSDLVTRAPDVRFVSTSDLADIVKYRDSTWLERSLRRRLAIWARRARQLPPFSRCARATGLDLPLRFLALLA